MLELIKDPLKWLTRSGVFSTTVIAPAVFPQLTKNSSSGQLLKLLTSNVLESTEKWCYSFYLPNRWCMELSPVLSVFTLKWCALSLSHVVSSSGAKLVQGRNFKETFTMSRKWSTTNLLLFFFLKPIKLPSVWNLFALLSFLLEYLFLLCIACWRMNLVSVKNGHSLFIARWNTQQRTSSKTFFSGGLDQTYYIALGWNCSQ